MLLLILSHQLSVHLELFQSQILMTFALFMTVQCLRAKELTPTFLLKSSPFKILNDVTKLIGKDYFIAKVDLRRAYRSVPVHPANHDALGLKWKFTGDGHFTYFVDTRLPFGGSSAPGIFHRLTQSVRRMMSRRGFKDVVVYLDDFLVIGKTQEECEAAYMTLRSLSLELGF
eukprot:TCONS_00032323-protein